MKFSIGEIAIYWNPGAPNHGIEVEIISEAHFAIIRNQWTGEVSEEIAHTINAPNAISGPYCMGLEYKVATHYLRKRRPPQELSTWDECAWKPIMVSHE